MKFEQLIPILFALLSSGVVYAQAPAQPAAVSPSDQAALEKDLELANQYYYAQQNDSAYLLVDSIISKATAQHHELLLAEALLLKGSLVLVSSRPRDQPTRYLLESLSIYTKLGNIEGIADCNLQLGILNYDIKNYSRAVDYFNRIIELDLPESPQIYVTHYLLAICQAELGNYEMAEQMFDLAAQEFGPSDTLFTLQIETFRAKMFTNQGEVEQAIAHFDSLLTKYHSYIEREGIVPTYAFLSTAHLKNKDYQAAIHYGRKVCHYDMIEKGASIYITEAEENLHQAYHALGKDDSAYYYLNVLSTRKDSNVNIQTLRQVAELNGQYEFEQVMNKKQAEQALKDAVAAKEFERERFTRNILIGAFLIALIISALFLNQKNKLSKEKNRSDALLLNILPEEIARELKDTGRAEARNFAQASILFTDFRAFTQASEALTAQELVGEINTCFEAFDHIIEKFHLEKIKTIGDSYMAAGGLPVPMDGAVKNTVLAALEMQAYITQRKTEREATGKIAFDMRAGIHTGPVVAGIVGVKKFQYDIWGDTVNTASRMESSGEPGKVNISQATYELLKNDPQFTFERRGEISVKGKGDLEMYFVEVAV